ncbi:hypothetical protein LINPERPRIM_LOCUS80 [Linum perenne]
MDLGLVFTEKEKDSSLVSILPGLQRLGKIERSGRWLVRLSEAVFIESLGGEGIGCKSVYEL